MVESAKRLRLRGIWRAIGLGLIVAVLVVSLVPIPVDTDLPENGDKLGHFLAYGTLMFWFGMLYPVWRRQLVVALAFCTMGVGVEFLQGMTDYRSFEVADMLANGTGVAMGWCIVLTPLKHFLAWMEGKMLRRGEV